MSHPLSEVPYCLVWHARIENVIEVVNPSVLPVRAKAVIFDFDGTLSLIRSGWMDVMVPLCVEQLTGLDQAERASDLTAVVEDFVWRLTGKETIYQMMALAEAVKQRGGSPLEPLAYKKMYLDRLWLKIRDRIEGLRAGSVSPERYLVPGAKRFLEHLRSRGLELHLASGTDDANVKEEAALLGVALFFEGRIYGAKDDLQSFSKALLVKQIIGRANGFEPGELLVFGDGFVEIEEVAKVGGVAVGVATAEPACHEIDGWKRDRLIAVGAHVIIPHFAEFQELISTLFGDAAFCCMLGPAGT